MRLDEETCAVPSANREARGREPIHGLLLPWAGRMLLAGEAPRERQEIAMKMHLILGLFGLSVFCACGGPLPPGSADPSVLDTDCPFRPHTVVVTGRLARVDAIGGESTGYGLATPGGDLLQLDLRAVEPALAAEQWIGHEVRAGGELRCVEGVETGWRRVLFVRSISSVGS